MPTSENPAIIFPHIRSDASDPGTYGALCGFIEPGTGRRHLAYPYIDSGFDIVNGSLGGGRLKWRINESCDAEGTVIGHATLRSTGA